MEIEQLMKSAMKWLGSAKPESILGVIFSGLTGVLALYMRRDRALHQPKDDLVPNDNAGDPGRRAESALKQQREERLERLQEQLDRLARDNEALRDTIAGLRTELQEKRLVDADIERITRRLASVERELDRLAPYEGWTEWLRAELARGMGVKPGDIKLPPPAPRTPGSYPALEPVTDPPPPVRLSGAGARVIGENDPTPPRAFALPPMPRKPRTEWP